MLRRVASRSRRLRRGWLVAISLLLSLFLGLVPPLETSAGERTWIVQCVDCPKYFDQMTDRALRLDAGGHPHIAYGGDHLYYARHDGSTWWRETVDPSDRVGSYASLALDAAGYPHISYRDNLNDTLKYAYKDASGWHVETVPTPGNIGYYTSLALDATGRPHISHAADMGSLWYAYKDGADWHTANPASGMTVGDTSLVIDGDGYPHIAFYNDDAGELSCAYQNAQGWQVSVLTEASYTGNSLSLALGPDGKKHISYYDENGDAVKYYGTGGISVVDSQAGTWWGHSSIALNGTNWPRVSYRDEANGGLKYAYRDASGWHPSVVDAGKDAGLGSSLAVDAADNAHISYLDGGALKYARQAGTTWTIETVDLSGRTGGTASLALDGAARVHIAYSDASSYDLRYAYQNGSGWHRETVDAAGNLGWSVSLAIDGNGRPCIAYSDSTNDVVKVAFGAAGGWQIETVAPEIDIYLSLALDALDRLHIVYQGTGGLSYAYHDGTSWHTELVGSGGINGQMPSLAVDDSGNAHIVYYDYVSYNDIQFAYAYREAGTWHVEEMESVGSMRGTALALDGDGVPHAAFATSGLYEMPPHTLKVGHRTDSGWDFEVVASEASSPALALDAAGQPHVAYGTTYSYRDAEGWHPETVTDLALTARSLQLGPDGRPHIALGDGYQLKYATVVTLEHTIYMPLILR
jgi:hypothetical protein